MADWATAASLATAGGTLVLAVATFGATRSANRSARIAERAMLASLRPLLLTTRPQDPPEKVMWSDQHAAKLPGGRALAEIVDDVICLAASVHSAGSGIAVIHGWHMSAGWETTAPPPDLDEFRMQSRDLYIPAGDNGFWQGAIRNGDDPDREPIAPAIQSGDRLTLEILYGDYEGGQRTITRMAFTSITDGWLCTTSRHWNLDRAEPR